MALGDFDDARSYGPNGQPIHYRVPEGGFINGDIVMSKHHGRGVVGAHPIHRRAILFDIGGGSCFFYTTDGRYFTEGAFEDRECVLALIERAQPE